MALDINWVEFSDYREKLNLEITSGGDWDLVFDASWIHLKTLAAAFTGDTMKANTWFGKMCYIPLFETYGNGLPVIWYRQGWADAWGVGRIDACARWMSMPPAGAAVTPPSSSNARLLSWQGSRHRHDLRGFLPNEGYPQAARRRFPVPASAGAAT